MWNHCLLKQPSKKSKLKKKTNPLSTNYLKAVNNLQNHMVKQNLKDLKIKCKQQFKLHDHYTVKQCKTSHSKTQKYNIQNLF